MLPQFLLIRVHSWLLRANKNASNRRVEAFASTDFPQTLKSRCGLAKPVHRRGKLKVFNPIWQWLLEGINVGTGFTESVLR